MLWKFFDVVFRHPEEIMIIGAKGNTWCKTPRSVTALPKYTCGKILFTQHTRFVIQKQQLLYCSCSSNIDTRNQGMSEKWVLMLPSREFSCGISRQGAGRGGGGLLPLYVLLRRVGFFSNLVKDGVWKSEKSGTIMELIMLRFSKINWGRDKIQKRRSIKKTQEWFTAGKSWRGMSHTHFSAKAWSAQKPSFWAGLCWVIQLNYVNINTKGTVNTFQSNGVSILRCIECYLF